MPYLSESYCMVQSSCRAQLWAKIEMLCYVCDEKLILTCSEILATSRGLYFKEHEYLVVCRTAVYGSG